MPLFYFILKNGHHTIPDREGEELTDLSAARAHATGVARELMRNRSVKTRTWRLEVCDEYLQPSFEVLFASIDDTMSHLPPAIRQSIEITCQSTASLNDTICSVRNSLLEVRETLNRADDIVARTRVPSAQTREGNEHDRLR